MADDEGEGAVGGGSGGGGGGGKRESSWILTSRQLHKVTPGRGREMR